MTSGSARQAGGSLAQQDAEGRASTRESLNEVVAHGDTGVVSVPAFLEKEAKFGMVHTGI